MVTIAMSNQRQINWHRWQLDDLNAGKLWASPPATAETATDDSNLETPEIDPTFLLEQLKQAARESGTQAGFAVGKDQGYQEGYQQGLEIGRQQARDEQRVCQQQITEQWQTSCENFTLALQSLDKRIAIELTYTVLDTVKQLIGNDNSELHPHIMRQITPILSAQKRRIEHAKLVVHPNLIAQIQCHLGEQLATLGWRIEACEIMHPQGFKVITSEGEIDASLETRWQQLCQLSMPEDA